MPLGIEAAVRGLHVRAVRGLFHAKRIQHGFKCVDKGKRPRTRRDWQPNVQYKYLYSEVLQRQLKLCVTSHALKRIDAAGGLDMYLLTEPLAKQGSLVADELRKAVVAEYKAQALPFPKKEGPTSIFRIINDRLQQAGLAGVHRVSGPAKRAPETTLGNHATPTATNMPSITHSRKSRDTRPTSSPVSTSTWSPQLRPPYIHENRELTSMRTQRKALVVEEILRRKGLLSRRGKHLRGVGRGRIQRARLTALRRVKGLNRHQLAAKIPARLRLLLRRRKSHSTSLTSGKRLDQASAEAVKREKLRLRAAVTRRNALVASKRGEARNEALKRIAGDRRMRQHLSFGEMRHLVDGVRTLADKHRWKVLAAKLKPNVPGLMIDGCFVPMANRHALDKLKTARSSVPGSGKHSPVDSGTTSQHSDKIEGPAASSSADVPDSYTAGSFKLGGKAKGSLDASAGTATPQVFNKETMVNKYLHIVKAQQSGSPMTTLKFSGKKDSSNALRDRDIQMGYPVGRKFRKIQKWLDDDWLKKHVVPCSGPSKYVLGNGMVLKSLKAKPRQDAQHTDALPENRHPNGVQDGPNDRISS